MQIPKAVGALIIAAGIMLICVGCGGAPGSGSSGSSYTSFAGDSSSTTLTSSEQPVTSASSTSCSAATPGTSTRCVDTETTFTGYLYAPSGVKSAAISRDGRLILQLGLVVLLETTPPTGYVAVPGAKVYRMGSRTPITTTDASGRFTVDISALKVKGRVAPEGLNALLFIRPGGAFSCFLPTVVHAFPNSSDLNFKNISLHPKLRMVKAGWVKQLYIRSTYKSKGAKFLDPSLCTWKSSNKNVATVDSMGVVRGVKRGLVLITAKCGSQRTFGIVFVRKGDSTDTYTLCGTITDTAGRPISGATVDISNGVGVGISGTDGYYSVQGLPGGENLDLTVYYQDCIRYTATIKLSGDTTLNIVLPDLPPEKGILQGHVLDTSGNPLSGVQVASGDMSTATDPDGNYAISDITPGTYDFTFSKEGYVSRTISQAIVAGETATLNVTLEVKVTVGALQGTVIDSAGNPLSGVQVTSGSMSAVTATSGSYTIANIVPGTYDFTFSKDGYVPQTISQTIVVGETATLNVTLEAIVVPPPAGTINGWVKNSSGNGIAGVQVSFVSQGQSLQGSGTTDDSGYFEFNDLTPGAYTLTASKQGYVTATASVEVVDKGQTQTTIVLLRTQPVLNAILDADGDNREQSAATSTITFTLTGASFSDEAGIVRFYQLNDDQTTFTATTTTWTDTQITGSVNLLTPGGKYWVKVSIDGKESVEEVYYYKGGFWQNVGSAGFSGGTADYTSLYISNDVPYVAYRDGANGSKATVMKYDGSTWQSVGTPGFSAGQVDYTSLYVDNGTPYVAYRDSSNIGGYLNRAVVMKYNGSTWEMVGGAPASEGPADYPSLFVYNGYPYVAYYDGLRNGKITVMRYNGSAWVPVGTPGFSSSASFYSSLFVYVEDGTPYVAYRDSGNYYRATVMRFNGTAWVPVGPVGFSPGWVMFTSLYVHDGIPYVAYIDVPNNYRAVVMKFNGTSWEMVGAPVSPGPSYHTSLFIYQGTLYVVYRDDQVNSAAILKKFNGTSWDVVGTGYLSAGTADYTSLFVSNGIPFVAYKDGANGGKATLRKFDFLP